MLEALSDSLNWILGLDKEKLSAGNMIARALIVYIMGIVLVRLDKRFIGERSAFDTTLRFLVGASLANAVTGSSPFFATLAMVLFIVFFQWVLAFTSFYNVTIEKLFKGSEDILYKNGKFQYRAMRRNFITRNDILEQIRKNSGLTELSDIEKVIYENSGDMSIIPRSSILKNSIRNRTKTSNDE